MQTIARFPRGQDGVSSCRLVTCAQASAGKRSGTSGTKRGHASLPWAFSEAAALLLRRKPEGQRACARLEKTHGNGKALPGLAHHVARAVYDRRRRDPVCERRMCLHGEWSGVGEPVASLDHHGPSLHTGSARLASLHAEAHIGACARPLGLCLDAPSGSSRCGAGRIRLRGAAPPPHLRLTGTRPCRVAMPLSRTAGGDCEVSRAPKPVSWPSARALVMAGAPRYVCGAATWVHQPTDMKTAHVASGERRSA